MNTPVDFKIAKLLKEKGFDELCDKVYIAQCFWQRPNSREKYRNSNIHSSEVAAPTIAQVVDWIYNNYKTWISVSLENSEEDVIVFYFTILYNDKGELFSKKRMSGYTSQSRAYEAAISYVIRNLI